MIRRENMKTKRIKATELSKYAEDKNRVFGVRCRDGINRTERYFKYRSNLRKFIERPEVSDLNIFVCEVDDV